MNAQSGLARQQAEFIAHVLDEERAQPEHWTERQRAGLAVYRNNYRAALVDALRDTYERTARWVGEDAFERAAAHHVITSPPASWTLDDAGAEFDETLAALFANDPEVAELAWLEWSMQCAFTAKDAEPLDVEGFTSATSGFGEEDWSGMRLTFAPGFTLREVDHDIAVLWNALAQDEFDNPDIVLAAPRYCLVWREGLRPTFALVETLEGEALAALAGGATYAGACTLLVERLGEEEGIAKAGGLLGRWVGEGLLTGISGAQSSRSS